MLDHHINPDDENEYEDTSVFVHEKEDDTTVDVTVTLEISTQKHGGPYVSDYSWDCEGKESLSQWDKNEIKIRVKLIVEGWEPNDSFD